MHGAILKELRHVHSAFVAMLEGVANSAGEQTLGEIQGTFNFTECNCCAHLLAVANQRDATTVNGEFLTRIECSKMDADDACSGSHVDHMNVATECAFDFADRIQRDRKQIAVDQHRLRCHLLLFDFAMYK